MLEIIYAFELEPRTCFEPYWKIFFEPVHNVWISKILVWIDAICELYQVLILNAITTGIHTPCLGSYLIEISTGMNVPKVLARNI